MRFIAIAALSAALLFTASPVSAERRFSPSVQAARSYALERVGQTQFRCLHNIVERESHWNPLAENKRTHARGLGQAYPASKMRRFGHDYMTNPTTQMKWLLVYVKKYGSSCGAWSFMLSHGWY